MICWSRNPEEYFCSFQKSTTYRRSGKITPAKRQLKDTMTDTLTERKVQTVWKAGSCYYINSAAICSKCFHSGNLGNISALGIFKTCWRKPLSFRDTTLDAREYTNPIHNVFLIIVGIIIAQLWGVVRRLVVCAFKTHEKRSVFLSLSLLSSFWPSLFSSFGY
ncbi:hypothetical protein XU18_0932 [Perkinsela sp. CCAP 1560/4]|nr:hypothetical protein XU18_0932 [Perkinsela sp. CCAP 1560/4]|eukprot:KNH08571.1 hypothetical protein XU18_0932 [Perkinsela sp. CCAP 1560/4]